MAYITGTITDSNPGPALYALMAPALTTAGYTLVDTVVISTKTHKVWKSAAANNAAGVDWFLDISYQTAGAAGLAFQAFEFYDPATDLGYRGPYTASSTVIDAATSSRYGATGYALETNWTGTSTQCQSALPVTSFAYWISVTGDRIVLLNSNEPTAMLYAGTYLPDPLYAAKAGASLYPLVSGRIAAGVTTASNSGSYVVSLTRIAPTTAGLAAGGWNSHLTVQTGVWANAAPSLPAGPFTAYPATATPMTLTNVQGVNSVPPAIFGQLRDVAVTFATGVVRGDTVTIASNPWVLGSTSGGFSMLLKAA